MRSQFTGNWYQDGGRHTQSAPASCVGDDVAQQRAG